RFFAPPTGPLIPAHAEADARPVATAGHLISGYPGSAAPVAGSSVLPGGENTKGRGRETVVCGVGVVHLDSDDRAAPFNYVDRLTGTAQSNWRRALINSDDYREHAAGLLLLSMGWEPDPLTGRPTRSHEAVLARDELVQLAAGLNDLPVYAMAV